MRYFLKQGLAGLVFIAAGYGYLSAQNFTDNLENWHKTNPIEKTYLQLDRENYFAGQTIWFKAYFMADFLPSAANSTLFVELLNNTSQVLVKKVLPVFGALSYGQIDLPNTLPTGSYQLRAYTPLMLNFDKSYLFARRIMIFGSNRLKVNEAPAATPVIHFYPEGGNLVAGFRNSIAFKATGSNGLPLNVSGTITDQENKTIISFATQHDGMGMFEITPEAGQRYQAVLNNHQTVALPDAVAEGVTIEMKNTANGKSFSIHYKGSKQVPAYIIGQMQHQIVFKQPLSPKTNQPVSGILQTGNLPSGVLQVTVFNKDGMPLAERLTFINNKEYVLPATVHIDTLSNGARKKNHFSISFPDSVTGNFSVAVTDAYYDPGAYRPANIWSAFLLTSDIPGYVHDPAYYFTDNPAAREDVELVLLTNGWRRFKWADALANTLPAPVHKDPGFISLSGKVNVAGSRKSFADRDLLVWIATDSGHSLQMVKTDAEGHFKMDSMIFFNKARVLFSDVQDKKKQFLTVKLNTDSLYRSYALPPLHLPYQPYTNNTLADKMNTAWYDYTKGEGVMLDSVVVLGTRNRMQQLEAQYMSGLFSGGIDAKTIDLTRTFIPNQNIFDYLQGRIPSLTIARGGQFGNYQLFYRQSGLRRPMQLYLDEMPADAGMIASLNPNDIALVKLFPSFVGAPGGGANGALAVYTKRGNDLNDAMESSAAIVDYEGYSILKEFYAPDYSTEPENRYNDYRLTLDWKPEVFISGSHPVLPVIFYNNDRTKKFKIVAEGITTTGKLLMIEQSVEPEK
ncbi:hypothetical protein A8C56_09040 [Niabella ginsenosidivorans]|uniref:TonB-dependent receptor plug domain-containing protein n=1 Tax=Niabella ginsenosidivorans TaxID=1176587 RepID=A0A1A9I197_9BACT|nr:hypothetical protein [Niabella ginsenosidivorans]ANH81105.1 hypothetical protein A8C56_09040 [Niabella ginsenosidivorans]